MPLPILKLEFVPFSLIIQHMDYMQVVHLTMMSEKFKKRMETVKMIVDNLQLMMSVGHHSVDMWKKGSGSMNIVAYYSKNYSAIPWFFRKMDGNEVLQSRFEVYQLGPNDRLNETIVKTRDGSPQAKLEMIAKIIRHLMSFINVTPDFCCRRELDFKNLFLFQLTKTIRNLTISQLVNQSISMSPEDILFILDKIKVDKITLEVKCTDSDFKYGKPLNCRNVVIKDCSWIDFNSMEISPITEDIKFKVLNVSNIEATINRIAKEWINGDGPNLKYFEIGYPYETDRYINFDRMVSGIKVRRVFSKKEMQNYWYYVFKFREIRRINDGKLATIAVAKWGILLMVWDDVRLRNMKREDLIDRSQ